MAATNTAASHVSRALDFYNKDSIYFCIGRTTPWEQETNPPVADPATTDIQEILGFRKIDYKQMVVPDVNGELLYRGARWTVVPPASAVQAGAKWVFIKTTISYDELPLGYYRQVGVYTGLVTVAGVAEGVYNLLPNQVQSRGILEILDNRIPIYRSADNKDTLSLIIQF